MTLDNARAYAGFDTETTGVDPATARLLEAALIVDNAPTSPVRTWEMIVERCDPGPDVPIPAEASQIHGIDRAALTGCRPTREVLSDVLAYLEALSALEVPIVIYNAPYDLGLLTAEIARHDLGPLPDLTIIDPLVLDRHYDPFRKGSRRLAAVAGHYGHRLDDAHAAAADVTATLAIARTIIDRYDLPHDPDALHRLHTDAYATWAENYTAHLDRTGSDRPRPTTVWATWARQETTA